MLNRQPWSLTAAARTVVLLVEDEPAVREMTRRVLDRSGHHVLTAASGHEAVAIAGQQGQIDVLLTDVIMRRRRAGRC